MPSLADHEPAANVKLLLLGDAKSGKTTSLASLVTAGYHLRILDFDNLLSPLASRIRTINSDLLANVEYRSLRDSYKPTAAGTIIDGRPKAWIESIRMLNHWKYDDIDLGPPSTWPSNHILVIDSLSRWCDMAYDFHEVILNTNRSRDMDGRAVFGSAQDDVERQLANLTSPNFTCNVIVICHGVYQQQPDGTTKIFPQGVGQKLSPKIPQYFPNYIRMTKRAEKRTMQLRSDVMIDLANTLPPHLAEADLDPDVGLAKFFMALRDLATKKPPAETDRSAQPKSITLQRRA